MKKSFYLLVLTTAMSSSSFAQTATNKIDTVGNVGIGTTSPQQRLHVEGPTLLNIFVNTSALGPISGSGQIGYTKHLPTAAGNRLGYFLTGSRGGANNNYNVAGMIGYAGGPWTAGSSYPAYLAFETTAPGSTARVERVRISPEGNVGIGTTSPGPYMLAVEGIIGTRKLKVTQVTPWADYVFEPTYQLPTLQEVEAFIKQHKHLPGVPSAAEVEKEGLDVGDNQATLLKKIEELTLYMIELKKEVTQLKEKQAEKQ